MVITLTFALLTSLMASLCASALSQHYLRNEQKQATQSSLDLLATDLESDLSMIKSLVVWIQTDTTVNSCLRQLNYPLSRNTSIVSHLRYQSWDRLSSEVTNTIHTYTLQRVLISCLDGSSFIQYTPLPSIYRNSLQDAYNIMNESYFPDWSQTDDVVWCGLQKDPFVAPGEAPSKVFILMVPINSANTSSMVGWAYIAITPDFLSSRLKATAADSGISSYVTFNNTNETFQYKNGAFVASALPANASSMTLSNGWVISVLPSDANLLRSQMSYIWLILLIFLAVFATGTLLLPQLNRMITDPVRQLTHRLERVSLGDFSRDERIEWDNEFGDIGRGINTLADRIQKLMDKKVQDEKAKQELQYQILQSQINPHFMYNTLNTIKWMATIQGADGIADVSTSLSRLLKNVAHGESIIPLGQELALVDDYFTIMQYRYGGNIRLRKEIQDESLLTCPVPRFLLQPIVENAIFHGIEPKGKGTITIVIARSGDDLSASVTDDGIGMREEDIQNVLSGQTDDPHEFSRHIGIANVNQRVKLNYGQQYGLTITSKPGEFTCMHFRLPIKP
ncbi:MAG: sensor histidine kinase [Lachnospiraceae bacterium]|nr:sensor histidine kinase [Lachnospiraceae bacterium]